MLIHFREYRSPSACRSEWKHVGTWNQTSSDPNCRAGFNLQLQEFYHPLQQVGPAGNNVGWIIIFLYPHQPIPPSTPSNNPSVSDAEESKRDRRRFVSNEPAPVEYDPWYENHAYHTAYDDWIANMFFGQ